MNIEASNDAIGPCRELSDDEIDGCLDRVNATFGALSSGSYDDICKSVVAVETAWAAEPARKSRTPELKSRFSDLGTSRKLPFGLRRRSDSDADLIESVRAGCVEAFGRLFERHVRSAQRLAYQLCSAETDADDLVADAFAKVLAAIKAGGGPIAAFRPYLLTAVRHVAYDKSRKEPKPGKSLPEAEVAELDQALAATAFASLPERWQTVLWHTAIEEQSPGEIAPLLGLTAIEVSVMAQRAREALREAFVDAHVDKEPSDDCRLAVTRLGAWTRGGLLGRQAADVSRHLEGCVSCQALAAELTDLHGPLADVTGAVRRLVAPVVLGADTDGYLANRPDFTRSAMT
ncbi:sigma-70 family RNA polymerase sigma factor [Lentzea sp. NPDC003310]|uniref:sigma-70 family RNA polymerase sigma factor n=1 Tax=Lentzea sp. NPDC003310 TaxID=3154447 RepID=UPI0033AB51A2